MRIVCFILFIVNSICNGQTLIHTDLSVIYDYKTEIKRIPLKDLFDSCVVKVQIINKSDKKVIQTLRIYSTYLFKDAYNNRDAKRSYITNKNRNKPGLDNDFGDIIVADFNFDNKEDIALKNDSGGNGGPLYNYYVQDTSGKFIQDKYLTNKVEFFPVAINNVKKTLTTLVHANAYEMCKSTYRIDTLTQVWKRIGKTYVK